MAVNAEQIGFKMMALNRKLKAIKPPSTYQEKLKNDALIRQLEQDIRLCEVLLSFVPKWEALVKRLSE